MDLNRRLGRKPVWRVDEDATTEELMADPPHSTPDPPPGGRTVFVDEDGQHRRLPPDLAELSAEQRDAALNAMSRALGAAPEMARMAAIERLTELHAAGKISEQQYRTERARLTNY